MKGFLEKDCSCIIIFNAFVYYGFQEINILMVTACAQVHVQSQLWKNCPHAQQKVLTAVFVTHVAEPYNIIICTLIY